MTNRITRTPSVESEILFRNIPWGISYSQLLKVSDFPFDPLQFQSSVDPESMLSPGNYSGKYANKGISGSAEASPNTQPSSNSFLRSLSPRGSFNLMVAGHKVIQCWAYFAQVPEGGKLLYSSDKSAFMAAAYNFSSGYGASKESMLDDLKGKLTYLYGQPTEIFTRVPCEKKDI